MTEIRFALYEQFIYNSVNMVQLYLKLIFYNGTYVFVEIMALIALGISRCELGTIFLGFIFVRVLS